MLGGSAGEPIQVVVVRYVDEELRATAVRLASIRHRKCARLVRDFRIGRMLILNTATWWAAGAASWTVGVLAVRATKLNHEPADHAMEVQPIVEVAVGEIDEILCRDGHLIEINLGFERSQRCVERSNRVSHNVSFVRVDTNAANAYCSKI